LPDYHYSYLVGVLIFGAAWVVCFILGKKYRAEIRWGSLIAAPMALTNILFVPQYWTPPSLFNLDKKIRIGIEDFLWAAAVGGIASVIAEIILKERLSKLRSSARKRHYAPFIVVVVVFIALEVWHSNKTIYNTIIAFAVGAVVIAFLRSDLLPSMLIGAASFAALYFALFLIFLALYPEFVQRYYNIPNLLGIYVLDVPIEELLFAASGGAIWSVAYEYVQGYRLEPTIP
jgi:lycopene cyclase-like protein